MSIEERKEVSNYVYNKNEINLIYISNSNCVYCNDLKLIDAIKKKDNALRKISKDFNFGYKFVGISIDLNINKGIEYFKNYFILDEIIIGSGWSNTGILRYIYTDFPSEPAVPQLIISLKTYNTISFNNIETYRGLMSEKILLVLIGNDIFDDIEYRSLLNDKKL